MVSLRNFANPRGLLAAGAIMLAIGVAQPARAITVSDGTSFQVNFDATSTNGHAVSAIMDFTASAISSTVFDLFVKVTNDTAVPPGSRFTAFGFSVSPDTIVSVSNPASGAFADDQDSLNWSLKTGQVPGSGITIEHCVGTGSNCQAANAGVSAGLIDRLILRLTFGSALTAFDLTNFAGRFAAIGPEDDSLGTPGTSTVIPLPAALPLFLTALGGLGLLGWRRRSTAAPA